MLTVAGLQVPGTPLTDVLGREGTASPAQILSEEPKLNEGVTVGVTFTVNVTGTVHGPGSGVNVYTPPLVLLTTDGLQLPEIPFVEVVGKTGTVPPEQIVNDVPNVNVGTVLGVTVIFTVTGCAHWPAVGVKVYDPLAVLLTVAGLQVPAYPLLETAGNTGGVVPAQKAGMGEKVGVNSGSVSDMAVARLVEQPLIPTVKLEYKPAFNPLRTICPDPLATSDNGPTGVPLSI